jgi:Patatin-like phospholipase
MPRPVGFVLGGGASFGAVQVGMLQALAEVELRPDLVVGTSVGSVNGAVLAEDPSGAANRLSHRWSQITREDVFPGHAVDRMRTWHQQHTYLVPSDGLESVLSRVLSSERFEELALPFAATATELVSGRVVHLESGQLRPAVLEQVARDVPEVARQVPVLYLPGPFPLTTSPLDFTASASLTQVAYEKSRAFLSEADPSGPGLYGDAPLIPPTGASEPL